MDKLRKLLDIDDEYINIHGLHNVEEELYKEEDELDIDNTDKLFFEKDNERISKKPTNMKVVPVIKEEDDYIFINKYLPKIPFTLINSAARGGGKTTSTLWLIKQIESYFDNIIIFSPTVELDQKFKFFFESIDRDFEFGINVFKEYSEELLTKILKKIKRVNKNKSFKEKVATLIIFDDIICSLPKQQKATRFNKLLLNNRHYNVSVIINSQSFKLFDSNLRKNCSQICLWRTDNMLELRNYYEEYGALLGNTFKEQRENFLKLYNYATAEPHSFFYINTHNRPNIFFKNFEEEIDVPSIISKPLETFLPDILKNKLNQQLN